MRKIHDLPHLAYEARLAIGRKAHHLVFVAVARKAEILRQRLIEDTERMRKIDLVLGLDAAAAADTPGGAGKIAEAVHRHRHRIIERRNEKSRPQMGKVM